MAVEGFVEITRENTRLPCIKVFTSNPDVLNCRNVRPGIGVLCAQPQTDADEQKLASFIKKYATKSAGEGELFLSDWSTQKLDLERWTAT